MDINRAKSTINGEDKKAKPTLKEKSSIPKKYTDDELNELIDKILLGEPVEKEYAIRGKIKFLYRSVPEIGVTNGFRVLAEYTEDVSGIEASSIHNDILIATYIVKYFSGTGREEDFTGEKDLYSPESIKKRFEFYRRAVNVQMRTATINFAEDFQEMLSEAYAPESLVNF